MTTIMFVHAFSVFVLFSFLISFAFFKSLKKDNASENGHYNGWTSSLWKDHLG